MTFRDRLWGLRREPLVHFLLGGLAIFLFFAWRGTEADPASRTVVIDRAQVESLAAQFAQTFRRAPTPGRTTPENAGTRPVSYGRKT